MSHQVGSFCYASLADAGMAACSNFAPVTTIVAGAVSTVSCESATPTGALNLKLVSTPIDGTASTTKTITQPLAYLDCQHQQYWDAGLIIFGYTLALVATCWPLWKFANYLGWGRGSES